MRLMPVRISIVTPWLDRPQFIEDYERSVRHPEVQVIIIDNGSASANAAAIRQMVARLGGIYLRNETNRWFSAANNQGLAVAQGGIVLFLNNDIVAHGNWLERAARDVTERALYGPSVPTERVENKPCRFVEGWCIAALRPVWDELGGWDAQAYSMPYMEDIDLGVRAAAAGIALRKTDWPIVHKVHGTSSSVPGAYAAVEHNTKILAARLAGQNPVPTGAPASIDLSTSMALIQAGRLVDAEAMLRQLLDRDRQDPQAWMQFARVLHASGRDEAAIDAMRRLIDLRPNDPQTWTELAILLARQNRHAEAAAAFASVVKLMPNHAASYLNLSKSLLEAGDARAAADAARKAVALDPAGAVAHLRLSQALTRLNEFDEAGIEAQEALRLNPSSTAAQQARRAAEQGKSKRDRPSA
jgi:Flp pilus assembly protein TadD